MPIDWQPLHEIIASNNRFVITSHVRPDADAIGSEIGLAVLLEQLGKQVQIVNPSSTPAHLKFLDPQGRVKKIGEDIPAAAALDTDVHIIVDTSAWQQILDVGKVFSKTNAKKVIIDHHLNSDDLEAIEFRDTSASATGVLITELMQTYSLSSTAEQVNALYAAIATDTGWFRFPNTDARTLRVAAHLIDLGVQPSIIYNLLYERSSLARLKLHSVVLARVALACNQRLAHTWVTRKDFSETASQPSDTEDLVNSCLTVEGVEAAFILVEQSNGKVKASLRSRSSLNVATIAAQTGGGGHRQAAGTMLPGPVEEAQKYLLQAFETEMNCSTTETAS